jgi:hypothetical protein
MSYICIKCVNEPGSHSFQKLKETGNGVSIFYSCPSKAIYYNDNDGILEHYDGMLNDNGNKPWIWIFDSQGFSMKHATNIQLAKNLALLINIKYSKNLKKIIIINSTWHINITLKFVIPFLDKNVQKIIFKYS